VIAHIGGIPVEEILAPLVGAAAAGLLPARAWIASHLPSRRTDKSSAL
jgi:hypothetical protein